MSTFFSTTFLKLSLVSTIVDLFIFAELVPSDGKLSSFKTTFFNSGFSPFVLLKLFCELLCDFFKKILPPFLPPDSSPAVPPTPN